MGQSDKEEVKDIRCVQKRYPDKKVKKVVNIERRKMQKAILVPSHSHFEGEKQWTR